MTLSQQPPKDGKRPNESKAEMTIIMLPSDANPKGNVFGGIILKYVDLLPVYALKDTLAVQILSPQASTE
jgi:acyl-CoA hydrolase